MTLKAFEMEPTWLSFPGRAILYPAVYQPHSPLNDRFTKHSISADCARVLKASDDDMTFLRAHMGERGTITAKSATRPEIECEDVPRLVAELAALDARNINRDRIFDICPIVSLAISPYRYVLPPVYQHKESERYGYMLFLHRVRISLP